jgi:predicted ester cyclase
MLTILGACAVSFMMLMYALERRHSGFIWPSPLGAHSLARTGSPPGRGRSVSLRRSGRSSLLLDTESCTPPNGPSRRGRPHRPRRSGVSEQNKSIVRRLISEVMNRGNLGALDELCTPELAGQMERWVTPFQTSFPDMRMDTVELIAEGSTVVGRFRCSGTHLGEWRGHPGSGRRFENVDEVYFFGVRDGRIVEVWGLEDVQERIRQLGFD